MTLSPKVSAVRLNLPDVDQAFPFLFDAMIELQAAVARHDEKDEIKSHLSDCVGQAIAIFRREEEAMEITRDRMALSHRSAHKKLLGSLQRIQKQLEEDGPLHRTCAGCAPRHHRLDRRSSSSHGCFARVSHPGNDRAQPGAHVLELRTGLDMRGCRVVWWRHGSIVPCGRR